MKKMLIYDLSNVMYSSFFNANSDKNLNQIDDKKDFWRFLLLSDLLEVKKKFNPDEYILAIDSKHTWRKDYFKYYKARRVFKKQKSPIDWDDFYTTADKFIDELEQYFPCRTIKVDKAEADDVIATLALNCKDDKEVIIVTKDKDFKQLLVYDNIKMYDLGDKSLVKCDDPYLFRIMHLLKGDSNDDVPNILSDNDVFVNTDKRQKRITQKVIKEMLDVGIEKFAIERDVVDNYKRNCKLILLDLENIPEDVQRDTMYQYETKEKQGNYETLIEYINKYCMYSLLEEL